MKRRYFQIKMDPMQHERMKLRARQLGVSIGEYAENLISAMEFRIKKAYQTTDIQEGLIDSLMIRTLMRNDFSLDKEKLNEKLLEVKESTTATTGAKTTSIKKEEYKASITV